MTTTAARRSRIAGLTALGPAFVAAIAYVDPGNVAANLTAGAKYGYSLVWAVVAANGCAVLVQYLSAKLGIVTGKSLPELIGISLGPVPRVLFWLQAEIVAAATDVAEVIGGALALQLLFGVPPVIGGLITGVVSMIVLTAQNRRGGRAIEGVITGLLAVLTVGFCAGLFVAGPNPLSVLGGIVPRFQDSGAVLLSASILGATVMPHAIYLHSALSRDHHGRVEPGPAQDGVLRATRWDVGLALLVAGTVNVAMLVIAAASLGGAHGTGTITGAEHALRVHLGAGVAVLFAIGLLASGLASTSVGSMAGAEIMHGLLRKRVPMIVRRAVTLAPAIVLLAIGTDPTALLVNSQVVLSFGIGFALVPLVVYTSRARLMGDARNTRVTATIAWVIAAVIIALNVALLVLAVSP
ncbi:Nramp family divalent metal transporter [Curtobacterium ammoniigenes]|uniref:Nramp family divalent metal transporter n=1 Tax=Curtobacterium ammoniigenes TaxID=395387 RepID=UPI00082E5126|nr:Nramp family divalent metal transporter [Curtobacterium ammoniigenes]